MNLQSAIQVVRSGWPHLMDGNTTIHAVTQGRLSDAPLWRVDSKQRSYALRGWHRDRVEQAEMSHRFVNHAARDAHINLPIPLSADPYDTTLIEINDLTCELAPWLTGAPTFAGTPTREKLRAASAALASLHTATSGLPGGSIGSPLANYGERLAQLQRKLSGGFLRHVQLHRQSAQWDAAWPQVSTAIAEASERARTLLEAHVARGCPQQWIWGDAWHGNILFEGEKVAGLVDFAAVRIDTPLADLARLLGSAADPQHPWWHEGLNAYDAVRPLSSTDRSIVPALHATATVLSVANWLTWVEEDRQFPDPSAAARRLDHFAHRLAVLAGLANPS